MIATALSDPTTFFDRAVSFSGLGVMIGIAWVLSTNRAAIRWRTVAWGVGLQLLFAVVVLSPELQTVFFSVVDGGVKKLLSFSEAGASFVFQAVEPHQIVDASGESVTFIGRISPPVKTFAFWILPTIIFFSSLTAILYHIGLMQRVVRFIAQIMQKTMGTSGPESLSAAGNIFVGQTEAPLLIAPFVGKMSRSELNAVMTGGFATVAGGVMAAYVGFLQDIPGIAGHLVAASIMSAPASLAIAKVMVPEDPGRHHDSQTLSLPTERPDQNVLEAAARGASDGMKLALNVAAMLVAFVGLIAMVDWMIGWMIISGEPLSLSRVLGWLFSPIAFSMGVPWSEATIVGGLLGEKLVLTELIAYIHLGEMMSAAEPVLSQRSAIIASYALCGFANFASIGIQLGGIGGIAPERMGDLADLSIRALIGGSLAAFMTGTVAGVLIG
ncbi:MAG: nucleoside transporter C-terminal domain-containing protein [Myxococcota bacterium]|nr:nucleoside transporter C-terminal domain-containing protein [Myxococcota bacterium]